MHRDALIQALSQPRDAITYALNQNLREAYSDQFVLETDSSFFRPFDFAREGLCKINPFEAAPSEWNWIWDSESGAALVEPENAWVSVTWKGIELQLVRISVANGSAPLRKH